MTFARGTALILTLALTACGGGEDGAPTLRSFQNNTGGPQEFAILPTKPIELPPSLELPVPTPGGANRTDLNPKADAVAALGGNPAALQDQGVAAADGALVTYAGRQGLDPQIRATTAAEDEQFRRNRGRFSGFRLFPVDRYAEAYERQALDPVATTQAYRRAGAVTPTANVE